MKKITSVALYIIILILFILYFGNNQKDFLELLQINPLYIIIIGLLHIVLIFNDGIFIKIVLEPFKKIISILESFYISIISRSGNYLTPFRGGAGLRAFYLKKNHNFAYSHFISTLSGYYVLVFLINSFLALISLVLININFGVSSIILYLLFTSIFILTMIISIVNFPQKVLEYKTGSRLINKILKLFQSTLKGWNEITSNRRLLKRLLVLTVINFIINFLIFFIEFKALDLVISFEGTVLFTTLSAFSLLISITPGSIGVREAVFILFSEVIGISDSEVLQQAVLDRSILFFILLVLLIGIKAKDIIIKNDRKKRELNIE